MLEILSSSPLTGARINSTSNMPVDYTSYLFATSPPGFDLLSRFKELEFSDTPSKTKGPSITNSNGYSNEHFMLHRSKSDTFVSQKKKDTGNKDCLGEKSCTGRKRRLSITISKSLLQTSANNGKSKSGMGKKKVSFADDLGYSLVKVKIITEPSDHPPFINPEILSALTHGDSAGVTAEPPLVLNFSQPASDYLAFREKLEKDMVSLENAIVNDYNVKGTIKVKNVSFEKEVKVRVTTDSWETFKDIPGIYVLPGPYPLGPFDTFEFEYEVPSNVDFRKKVEFCVCYEASGSQYWDNNRGCNYEITSADWKSINEQESSQSRTVFTLGHHNSWTDFSSWDSLDTHNPYY